MKLSIFVIVILSATYLHSQDNKIVFRSETLEVIDIDTSFISSILGLYDRYVMDLPTRKEHQTDLFRGEFLSDCDMHEVESKDGFDVTFWTECRNKEHFKDVPLPATFQGFMNWLRKQK